MPDYSKGQIYKIVDIGYNKCYIGRTVESLSQRMARHRTKYKSWKEGKYHFITSFSLFDEYGVDNCKIEWIENYPCNSKKQLDAREGYYQQTVECINKNVSGRSSRGYYKDKCEEIKEKVKKYKKENPTKIKEGSVGYYKQNKDKLLENIIAHVGGHLPTVIKQDMKKQKCTSNTYNHKPTHKTK